MLASQAGCLLKARLLLLACLLHNLNNSTRFLKIFIICRPRNNRRKPGEVRIVTKEQLAATVPPRKFLRVVASKTIVYEADKNEYFNTHGVGPYFGEIINPFGLKKEVHWADDDQTMTSTSYLRDAQARNLQIEAHKCYMLAIGLESNQLDKEITKKSKAKKKTKKTTKITVATTSPPRGVKNANNDAAPAAEIGEQTKHYFGEIINPFGLQKEIHWANIRHLHYKTIKGRRRFGKYVNSHFEKFIQGVKQYPEWTKFFDDLGKGDAPIEYLVLVEIGLRSFGDDIHAMGSRAMDSKERWFAVDLWRKREAYIAAIRLIREHLSYPQWDCYKLEDYSERQALHKTFVTRHFPLSNGDSNRLEGHLADPANWSVSDAERPCKRAKLEGEVKSKVKVKRNAPGAVPVKPMVWDVENNCFVPF